jgi:hypothetical protein
MNHMYNRSEYLNKRNEVIGKLGERDCHIGSYCASHRELVIRAIDIQSKEETMVHFQDVTYLNIPTSFRVSRWELLDHQSCPEVHPILSEDIGESHFAIRLTTDDNKSFYVICGLFFVEDKGGCR